MADQDILGSNTGFFRARWRGDVPLGRLFWVDMVVVGTTLNLATSFGALVALGLKWPEWAAAAVYFSPLPYNLFLVLSVWWACDKVDARTAGVARAGALAWVLVATLI